MRNLPNLLTAARIVLSLAVFAALAAAGEPRLLAMAGAGAPALQRALLQAAFVGFVVAAVTDFFDGWLARRWRVTSVLGAILDPIADKVLVCAALLGLAALSPGTSVIAAGALILMREFAVSALRETLAARALKLPVTLLAKWKTTAQLVAIGALIGVPAFLMDANGTPIMAGAYPLSEGLLWIAAAITLVTGAQYAFQARRALTAAR
jgi:CDP-diacylglycerol--glycerol-3-phosphate 3-phosphatidyltransferase